VFLFAKERRFADSHIKICPGISPFDGGPCPYRPSTAHHLYKKAYRNKHREQADVNQTVQICPWHHGHIHHANIPDGMAPAEFYRKNGIPPLVWGGRGETVKMILGRSLIRVPIGIYQDHFANLPRDRNLIMPLEKIIWLMACSALRVSEPLEKQLYRRWDIRVSVN